MGHVGRPRKFRKRKTICICVEEEEYQMLRSLAKFKKVSLSEIVRTIIRYHLNLFSAFPEAGKEVMPLNEGEESEMDSIIDGAIELKVRDNIKTMNALVRTLERNRNDRDAMDRLSKIMDSTIDLIRKMKRPNKQLLRDLGNIVERARKVLDAGVTYVT